MTTSTDEQRGGTDYALMLSSPDPTHTPMAIVRWFSDHRCLPAPHGRSFTDHTGTLFLRWEFNTTTPADQVRAEFAPMAEDHGMTWTLTPLTRPRLLILVSREDHVLAYLLSQHAAGMLPAEIVAVASNHTDVRPLVVSYGVPFEQIPWPAMRDNNPAGQATAHRHLTDLARDVRADTIVMARFMQTIAEEFCDAWFGRLINVHHGDLPAFEGARPYRQALARGVKGVGATAHYVLPEIDKGPIITQEWRGLGLLPPHPSETDLKREGRLAEIAVTDTAIRLHSAGRLFIYSHDYGPGVVIM